MELRELSPIAIILIVAVIVIAFGATILGDIKTENYESVSVDDENHTTVGLEAVNFALDATHMGKYGNSLSVTSIYSNTTDLCNTGNYTVYPANQTITIHRGGVETDKCNCTVSTTGYGCNVSYSYNSKTIASNASETGETSMVTFAKWVPTIAIIAAAAIIVGIIVSSFRT